MQTLSTNFKSILKKDKLDSIYIVKINATLKASPYTSKNFYISNRAGDITDSGTTYPLLNILKNPPKIKEKIDIAKQKTSIGGFSITLANGDNFYDNFGDYNFYNKDIYIYFGDTTLTDLSDFNLEYKGVLSNFKYRNEEITINIDNSTHLVQKQIPETKVTKDNYPDSPEIGAAYPIIYGNNRFEINFRYDNGFQLAADWQGDRSQNTSKMVNLGQGYWLVAGHEVNSIDIDEGDAIWAFDPIVGRQVELVDWTLEQNTSAGCIIKRTGNTFKDYRLPESATTSDWTDIDNATDSDVDTYTEAIILSGDAVGTKKTFTLTFEENKIDTSYINNIELWANVYIELTSGIFKLYAENDVNKDWGNPVGSTSPTYFLSTTNPITTGALETVDVTYEKIATSASFDYTARVHEVFMEVEYENEEELQLFFGGEGKKANATLSAEFTGLSTGDLIENPCHIIGDVLFNYLGLSSISSTFDDTAKSGGELNGWVFQNNIEEFINTRDYLDDLSKSCKSISRWDSSNTPSILTLDQTYTTDKVIDGRDVIGSPDIYESKLKDIVNDLKLDYHKSRNYQERIERADDRADVGSQDVYGYTSNTIVQTDFINDDTTAGLLADFYCKDDDDSFWSVLHKIVEVELPIIGLQPYESGTFTPYLTLEIGDVVEFTNMQEKVIGDSFDSTQFIVIDKNKDEQSINLTVFEV